MTSSLMSSIRTLLAEPDRPDIDTLFAVLDSPRASEVLACLAPPGSLIQIAAALVRQWSWDCDGWVQQTDKLVGLITDPRCPSPSQMIMTWNTVPGAVGTLRDRTAALVAWGQQRLTPVGYANLAILLGPSDESARLLVQSPSPFDIGTTLRRWSMAIDPGNPTAWQAMIVPNLRKTLRQKSHPSWAFPAWGGMMQLIPKPSFSSALPTSLMDGRPIIRPSVGG